MGILRRGDPLARIEQRVKPEGCLGRIGVTTESGNLEYNIVTHLGCAGLEGGLADAQACGYRKTGTSDPNGERRKFERDALRQSAAHFVAICATCPLGPEGRNRETAQLMRVPQDDMGTRLQIAIEERAAAEARLAAAQTESQMGRAITHQDLPS